MCIQQLLDGGKKLGVNLNENKGIFVYELGGPGNTSLQYMFTLAACEGQNTQGFFHMTGIINDNNAYDIMCDTLSTGIMIETIFEGKSIIRSCCKRHSNDGNVLDGSIF